MFALGVFFLLLTINNVFTETYEIEKFNRSKETIRSPITIENKDETKRKVRETIQSVADRYDVSEELTEERINFLNEIFEAISKIEKDEEDKGDKEEKSLTKQEKLQSFREIVSSEITNKIDEEVFIQLMEIAAKEREEGKSVISAATEEALKEGVRVENLESTVTDVKQAIKYSDLSSDLKRPLTSLIDFLIVENSFFDAEETMEARKKAANSIEPVMIRAGEIIVREGQVITNEKYEELELVGLLNKERNLYPVLGLILLILLITGIITHEMNHLAKSKYLGKGAVISVLLISVIIVLLMKVISLFELQNNQLYFIVPVATGALLLKQLINERLAIIFTAVYAILGSVIFNGEIPGALNIEAGIYFYISQIAAIIFLSNIKDRLTIVRAGIGMSIVNVITVILFIFLSFEKYTFIDVFMLSGFAIAAALLSAVLTLGLLPFFETGLGMLSDIKLISLANPNQPLLRKLLTEAPGTYHHSIMVANLSETACEAVGANGLLARVGAYYHDIGKTARPHYFIENQLSIKNPHDDLDPLQSAEIIIRHPYDGAEMLIKQKLPKEIIDIAKQHHGTTLLKYFYYKEKETNETISEKDFRYPGPKPQTKETAIICVCDSVEAAARSLKEPTEMKIDEIVSSIVNDRLMDGQFDECDLTIKELKQVRTAICETLKGIFHSRIQYPVEEAE